LRKSTSFVHVLAIIACEVCTTAKVITTFAGVDLPFGGEGKPARDVALGGINHVVLDKDGNILVAD
jgi:hypothetical protein